MGLRAALAALALTLAAASPALADSATVIDFETGYTAGIPVTGQQGWTGGDCGAVDEEVAATGGTVGPKALRFSNAMVNGCFRDAFSPPVANEAGEPTADSGGFSSGTRQAQFNAAWWFKSATGGYQPGLNVQVSPDRGDGARMSYVGMKMENGSETIVFRDVEGVEPGHTAPCFQCANFVETDFPGYDPTEPHLIGLEMRFIPGPSNDEVTLTVDNKIVHVGTSWEDYYTMDTESSPTSPRLSRTVNRLLIRATGDAAPATLGQGYLIDDLLYASEPIHLGSTTLDADPILLRLSPLHLYLPVQLSAHLTSLGFPLAGRPIKFTSPLFGTMCTGVTNAGGTATCTLPPSLVPLLATLSLHYTASYAGDSAFAPASDSAYLIK